MMKRGCLISGIISTAASWVLLVVSENRNIPLSWIILASVGAGLAFKLFYRLEE